MHERWGPPTFVWSRAKSAKYSRIEIMMEALKSYSGEESVSEDDAKEENKKSDQETEDKPVGFNS